MLANGQLPVRATSRPLVALAVQDPVINHDSLVMPG